MKQIGINQITVFSQFFLAIVYYFVYGSSTSAKKITPDGIVKVHPQGVLSVYQPKKSMCSVCFLLRV